MEKKPIPFILLDESVLTNGVRVLIAGVDTAQFEKNPVMFYRHDDWALPVGKWENIRKEGSQLLADAVFDYDDQDKDVQRLIGKVERGFVRMASAGLVELEGSYEQPYVIDGQDGPTIIKCRIREASIVPIGANHNAFRLFDANGKEIPFGQGDAKMVLSDFIVKPPISINNMNKTITKVLNLADDANMDAQVAAVELLLSDKTKAEERATAAEKELTEFKKEKTERQKAEALNLVDAAIKEGRLEASAKEATLKLFDANFEDAKAMLNAIPKRRGIVERINAGQGGSEMELADLDKQDWNTLDRNNKLAYVKEKFPELYERKHKERFGN